MNSYKLSRNFFDWSFENPEKVSPNHVAIYFFAIEHCNRLGWKEKFGFPTSMAKDAVGIKSYNTYIKAFNDLVEWGFITLIEKSKNQYSSNIIALSNFNKASTKALDKALVKHLIKHSESTSESISSINKQGTNKQGTRNKEQGIVDLKKSTLHSEMKKIFLVNYEKIKGTTYYWTAKDATNLKTITKKIDFTLRGAGREVNDVSICKAFNYMCENVTDNWILDNYSVSILNSKYNEILGKLKNGTPQKLTETEKTLLYVKQKYENELKNIQNEQHS